MCPGGAPEISLFVHHTVSPIPFRHRGGVNQRNVIRLASAWHTIRKYMQRTALLALVGLIIFNGCSILPPRIRSGSRAFISYWPTKTGDHRLRLAIKDNIDMQGVVTTAG